MRSMKKCTAVAVMFMTLAFSACEGTDELQAVAEKNTSEAGTDENGDGDIREEVYEGLLSDPAACGQKNAYDTLNVATYITKVDDTYFIADCYHNQIIYNENLTDPLNQWNVLTDKVHYAHTIASDSVMFLVDDTENNRLLVFQKIQNDYVHTQTLENIGMRPHFVQYDAKSEIFLAWSSITGEMYFIKKSDVPDPKGYYSLYIEKILKIDALFGVYVRSFTMIEDEFYFVSGHNNQKILKATIDNSGDGFEITAEYPVAKQIAGMVQLIKIGKFYYITVSTDNQENQDFATILRTDNLENLASGTYEEIYDQFGVSRGTPYYITEIDGMYYMAHHRTNENIIAFDIYEDQIEHVAVLY